jgi:cytochrome c oxidase cbb3-type subunit 3
MTTYRRTSIALILGPALLAACQSRPQHEAAGVIARDAFFIGPIPGPDRVVPRPVNPYADNQAARVDGRRLFGWYNCSGCHGNHAGGGMGPSLRDSLWRYGGDDAAIFASITEGRQFGMPAWGAKAPSGQIWQIVTYIKSMRTPNEPDAPR